MGLNMNIKIYNSVSDMTGIGEEWLLSLKGEVIAVFIDGMLRCEVFYVTNKEFIDSQLNTKVTKI